MEKIKKVYNFKIISVFIAVIFSFETMAYSALDAQHSKANLRVPLDTKRLDETLQKTRIASIETIDEYLQRLSLMIPKDMIEQTRTKLLKESKINFSNRTPLELYKRLKDILTRKSYNEGMIKEDFETIELLFRYCELKDILIVFRYQLLTTMYYYSEHGSKNYFDDNQDLNPAGKQLTRGMLVQIIRDLFNPFFEREGVFIVDLFSGKKPSPSSLPLLELEKLGYNSNQKLYIYGIDRSVPSELASSRNDTGVMKEDILYLSIPDDSVNVVTMFHPESLVGHDRIVEAAKRILCPGGRIYIAPHSLTEYRNDPEQYRIALIKNGFENIEVISPYPAGYPYSKEYGIPSCLIKAQKPIVSKLSVNTNAIVRENI